MQKTIYTCDQCGKTFGLVKHISLAVTGEYSGIAVPPLKDKFWGVHKKLTGKFMHFCNGSCIGKYFTGLMKLVK